MHFKFDFMNKSEDLTPVPGGSETRALFRVSELMAEITWTSPLRGWVFRVY